MVQPLRDEKEIRATFDPETGLKQVFDAFQKVDVLSDAGSVNTEKHHLQASQACGCFGEPGGRCGICRSVDCKYCFGRCCRCARPLCLRHSRFLPEENGTRVRLCPHCYEIVTLKHGAAKCLHLLAGVFRRGRKGP
jgi:hypothetical protein